MDHAEALSGCGVIYAVTGEAFYKEMRTSIRSIRAIHPDLPILVCYSWHGAEARTILAGIEGIHFLDMTKVVEASGLKMADGMERSRGVKINTINYSPFKYSLFLDSHTYVRKSLIPFFDELRSGDTQIILTNEPVAVYPREQYDKLGNKDRPNAGRLVNLSNPRFFNSGVFGFRDTVRDFGLGLTWVDTFMKQSRSPATSNWARLCDQSALNKSVAALADIPRKILPNTIWNAQCKILKELFKQGRWDDIHIIHCKMVHILGPEPTELLKSEYIDRFDLVEEA